MPQKRKSDEITKSDGLVCGFDITVQGDQYTPESLKDILEQHFKEYAFQKEKGASTGYIHYQVRGKLYQKKRLSTIIRNNPIPGGRWSVTSTHNFGNYDYVTKECTRVDGPWFKEPQIECTAEGKRVIDEITSFTLYPWQQSVIDILKTEDRHSINILVDPVGNIGKSVLVERILFIEKCGVLLPTDHKNHHLIIRTAYFQPSSAYVFYASRALSKRGVEAFYKQVEVLKDGILRYGSDTNKKLRIGHPRIFIFTTFKPDLPWSDKWKFWRVSEDKSLIPF